MIEAGQIWERSWGPDSATGVVLTDPEDEWITVFIIARQGETHHKVGEIVDWCSKNMLEVDSPNSRRLA